MQELEDIDNTGVYRGLLQLPKGLLVICRASNKVTSPSRMRVAFAPSAAVLMAREVAEPLPISTVLVVTPIEPSGEISTDAMTPSPPVPNEWLAKAKPTPYNIPCFEYSCRTRSLSVQRGLWRARSHISAIRKGCGMQKPLT